MKKLFTLLFLVILGVSNLTGQTWKRYNIASNTTSLINYTITSTEPSKYTNGNTGILNINLTSDTLRNFNSIDLVNDPNAYPWRMTVKFGNVTGVLIDPYHVLTAGHTVTLDPGFGAMKFYPGYGQGNSPYGFAYPEYIYLPNNYSISSAADYAIIKLDRPIGSLTGWAGYGYNNDNNFYINNKIFFNPSYPSADIFNGELLYNWKGKLDFITGEYAYSFRTGFVGMSGSPLFTSFNNNLVTYGVLTSTGIKFNKININKFDAIKFALDYDIPSAVDIIPLTVTAYPKTLKTGNNLDSLSFYLTNYSSVNYSNQQVNASVYVSQDSIITETDQLIQTYNVVNSIPPLNSGKVLLNNISLPGVGAGNYWIGLIITGDNNSANNITRYSDAFRISVVNTDYVKISGSIISAQSNSGISGVSLQGLTNTYTDYGGNYSTFVPVGFSGVISPVKEGFSFSQNSFTINNITGPLQMDLTTSKITYTLSVSIKSPVQQSGVVNVLADGLRNKSYSDPNGNIEATVYHGWSGNLNLTKSGWIINPSNLSFNNITSDSYSSITAGFRISGYVYNDAGDTLPNVQLQGFPSNVLSNSRGYYFALLDSGWSGTIVPVKDNAVFNPETRVYTNLHSTSEYQDYQQLPPVYANVKLFLSGPYNTGTDTMKYVLKQRNYFPVTPPDTFSNNVDPFVFKNNINYSYTGTEQRIVDWVVIEVLNPGDFSPVDTVPAVVRFDGKLLSCKGETMIPLRKGVPPGNYYIVIRHRNHIAVMSGNTAYLFKNSVLYDFTSNTGMYWGNEAKLLKSGLYGMFTGDSNYDGKIDLDDYKSYNNSTISAAHGYSICDFNLDGYVTSLDFVLFAPNNRLNISTKINLNNKKLIIK